MFIFWSIKDFNVKIHSFSYFASYSYFIYSHYDFFFLMRLAPGSPFMGEKVYPPEVMANINAKYGLDKPLIVQYGGLS